MMHRMLCIGVLLAAASASLPQEASAGLIGYQAFLDGPSEDTPNASPGTGYASLLVDTVAHTMKLSLEFNDLIGTTTAAHIHAPTALPGMGTTGVATQTPTFAGFPLGVSSGTYMMTFDLTDTASYNPAFVTANGGSAAGAEAALLGGLADGKAYLNIHTALFPGGEIRGFLQPVPEPASWALLGIGATCVGIVRRRRGLMGLQGE